MAISTTNYFSNSLVGLPQVGADVDIYEVHSTPKFAIGTRFDRQDGAAFRYGHFSAATTCGVLVSQALSDSIITPLVNVINAPSSTYQSEADPKGVYPSAKGSKFIIATLAGVADSQYEGGYISIAGGTGSGYMYRIKGNDATGTTASGLVKFTLYDRLQASMDTTSTCSVIGSKYQDLTLAAANTDVAIVAGATINTTSTSYAWGWIQTKGIAAIKCDGLNTLATTPGNWAVLSTGGAVKMSTAALISAGTILSSPIVGLFATAASGGTVGLVDLKLD